jgi:ribosomal protein S18 acetylase RimI-like enzyme
VGDVGLAVDFATGVSMSEQIEIRPYEDADEPAVAALWRDTLHDAAPHNDPVVALRKKRASGCDLFYVAVDSGRIIGTTMGGYDGHRGWIYSVAVDPEHRRRGIGSALLRHLEAELRRRGCLKLNLQVRTSNLEVIAFYESLGFTTDAVISLGKRLYPKDAVAVDGEVKSSASP